MFKRLLLLMLCLLVALPVIAQEDEEGDTGETEEDLPVIPYFSASNPDQKFNVPIPEGWRNASSSDVAQLVYADDAATIYALAVTADSIDNGVTEAIAQVIPDSQPELRYSNELNIDGINWSENLYQYSEGTITAFSQQRDDVVYSVIFTNQHEDDFYMLAVEHEDEENVQPDIDAVLTQLYPEFEPAEPLETDVVEYADRPWTRSTYALGDGGTLQTLHQVRGRNTFIVVEAGEGDLLETINRAFFTVVFGFFVTPDSVNYLYLGLAAVAVLMTLFVVAFLIRQRNLQKDMALVRQLQQDET